jgi:hypothetical protein
MAKVLAKHKAATVTPAPAPAPVVVPVPAPAPVVAVAKPAPKAVAASQKSTTEAEVKASQDKVKEMAVKLGIPFTDDLMGLGSNSAISDALIEKAVAAGKSEAEINKAMASL